MAGRIRQEDVEAVKERTDIVSLVGAVPRAEEGRCTTPCRDSAPSIRRRRRRSAVSPAKQVFYCFGCGKGGDAVTFLRELENLSYVEAVERLAQQAGVTLRYEGDSPPTAGRPQRRARCSSANEEAGELLPADAVDGPEAAEARAYLAERGISRADVEGFGVGYAPGYPDFLLRRLAQVVSGPSSWSRPGRHQRRGRDVRDRFRGRITFPIHDLQGRGRVRRAHPAERPARAASGEVPEHGRDADLPEGRAALQPPPRAADGRRGPARPSWSRATPT